MLRWLTAPVAYSLLMAAAGALVALLVCVAVPRLQGRLASILAGAGLMTAAFAWGVLKMRTGVIEMGSDYNPDFVMARNAQSLAFALVPFALGTFRFAPFRRFAMLGLGLAGTALLVSLILAGSAAWPEAHGDRYFFKTLELPGMSAFAGHGNIQTARWLWFAGSLVMALSLILYVLPGERVRRAFQASEGPLALVLCGLGVSSAAMGIFFWHQADEAHRISAFIFMVYAAITAIALTLGYRTQTTARWTASILAVMGLCFSIWLGSGCCGGDFADGEQALLDVTLVTPLLVLLMLAAPAIGLEAGVRAMLRRWPFK